MNNNIPIQQVIDQGLKIMQNGQVTDAMYQVWVEYSKSILNMTTKNPCRGPWFRQGKQLLFFTQTAPPHRSRRRTG